MIRYLHELKPGERFAVLGNGGDSWILIRANDCGATVQKKERRLIQTKDGPKTFCVYNRQVISNNTLVRRLP